MNYSTVIRSSLGAFATRMGMSVVEFLGIFYLATAANASTLGIYSLFIALVRVVDLVTDLGINEAQEKRMTEGSDRAEFFTASLSVRLVVFAVVALSLVGFGDQIAMYIGYELALPFLLVASFSYMIQRTVQSGLNGEKKVGRSGLLDFVTGTGQLVVWVGSLTLGYGLFGVLFGVWAGQTVAIIVGLILLSTRLKRPSWSHFKSLYRYARYSWLGGVEQTSWLWTDTLVLGFFVAPSLIGIYELSWQITGVLFFLASAISSTLFVNVSELATNEEHDQIADLLERSLLYAGIIAIPGFVGGAIFAEPLLATFGAEYRVGAIAVVILVLARVFHSYEIVFEKAANALNRPDLVFRANGVFICLNLVLNVIAISTVGWVGAAFATTAAMGIKTVLVYHSIRSIADFTVPAKEIVLEGVSAIIMGACLWALTPAPVSSISVLELVVLIGIGILIYALCILLLVERIRIEMVSLLTSNVGNFL